MSPLYFLRWIMTKPTDNPEIRRELIEYLSQFVTEKRFEVLINALNLRTRYLTVVLEDIFQPQNASAVLRTCECFGIQDIHIIENRNKFKVDTEVAMGSAKWLTIKKYNTKKNNSEDAILALRAEGYRIVATSPHIKSTSIQEFDLSKGKAAFVFGTELTGLTKTILDQADEYVNIPMFGLTESLNLSVSVAVIMQFLVWRLQNEKIDYFLNQIDKEEVICNWLKLSIKSSSLIEKRFLQSKFSSPNNK